MTEYDEAEPDTYYRFTTRFDGTPQAEEYEAIRYTPMGVYLDVPGLPRPKFVRKRAKRSFAYPCLDDAWCSYQMRRDAYVKRLEAQLERAKYSLDAICTGEPLKLARARQINRVNFQARKLEQKLLQ